MRGGEPRSAAMHRSAVGFLLLMSLWNTRRWSVHSVPAALHRMVAPRGVLCSSASSPNILPARIVSIGLSPAWRRCTVYSPVSITYISSPCSPCSRIVCLATQLTGRIRPAASAICLAVIAEKTVELRNASTSRWISSSDLGSSSSSCSSSSSLSTPDWTRPTALEDIELRLVLRLALMADLPARFSFSLTTRSMSFLESIPRIVITMSCSSLELSATLYRRSRWKSVAAHACCCCR